MGRGERLQYSVVATVELILPETAEGLRQRLATGPRAGQLVEARLEGDLLEVVINVWARSEVEVFHFAAAAAKDALAPLGRVTALRTLEDASPV